MKKNRVVAYFDFDGTISKKDTLLPFLLCSVGYLGFIVKLPVILPILLLYVLKIINNETAKEKVLNILLKGKKEHFITKKAQIFAHKKMDRLIKPEIFAKLEYHQEHQHIIILVSANLAIYLKFWAMLHKIDAVIATELDFYHEKFTGRLATPNCYGAEKVKRIQYYLEDKEPFSYSYGYGNSAGDYELLNYVDEGYWVSGSSIEPWKKNESS